MEDMIDVWFSILYNKTSGGLCPPRQPYGGDPYGCCSMFYERAVDCEEDVLRRETEMPDNVAHYALTDLPLKVKHMTRFG